VCGGECRDFATDVFRAELFTVFVNSLTWTGRAVAASGVRHRLLLLLLLAISQVLFYSRCNRVAAYMPVLASKRCKWL